MSFCGEKLLVSEAAGVKKAATLTCNCWGCDDCGPRRKRRLIAEAISGLPTTFITLTWRPRAGIAENDAATMLSDAWRKARRAIMKHYGWKRLDFFAVLEKTQKGQPHIHILARCGFIDQRLLSGLMRRFADSPIVDIRRVSGKGRSASYAAKYAGKASTRFGSHKRYWCSQKYHEPRKFTKDDMFAGIREWTQISMTIVQWFHAHMAAGFEVKFIGKTRCIATGPP